MSTGYSKSNITFVVVGVAGGANSDQGLLSRNGTTWTPITLPSASVIWNSIAYGNGIFVAVSGSSYTGNNTTGTNSIGARSTDGINWTLIDLGATGCRLITYGGGIFLAIASGSSVSRSTDGITWVSSSIESRDWRSVSYNGVRWAVLSASIVAYSTDGINWTYSNINGRVDWAVIASGGGKEVVLATHPQSYSPTRPGNQSYAYTTDTTNWTVVPNFGFNFWHDIIYANGRFVGLDSGYGRSVTSTDGVNWTDGVVSLGGTSDGRLTYKNGTYVAIGNSGFCATSSDGITWTQFSMPLPPLSAAGFRGRWTAIAVNV
jgi:hypothetical protein